MKRKITYAKTFECLDTDAHIVNRITHRILSEELSQYIIAKVERVSDIVRNRMVAATAST